jgi:hypothetical protein
VVGRPHRAGAAPVRAVGAVVKGTSQPRATQSSAFAAGPKGTRPPVASATR